MANVILISLIVAMAAMFVGVVTGIRTGRWRWIFAPLRIHPRRMTVARLGLVVRDPANVGRVDSILASFLDGFNEMLTAPSRERALAACDARSELLQPFAHEGYAMGYVPRALLRYDAAGFERDIVKPRPEFRYLYYVGLGFWSGMRNHSAAKVMRMIDGLDPLHRYLVFDGYGFKVAFFDAPRSNAALARLGAFEGYARNAAWQGVGRALYFRFMDDPRAMIEQIRACGDHAVDVAAGVGLASVFVNPDRLERAIALAELMPAAWRPHVHLGMCFGLKARSINHVDRFDHDLSRVDREVQEAVRVAIRECDRVELLVRSEGGEDRYRVWRERVTTWMDREIEFPLRRARSAGSERAGVLQQASRG